MYTDSSIASSLNLFIWTWKVHAVIFSWSESLKADLCTSDLFAILQRRAEHLQKSVNFYCFFLPAYSRRDKFNVKTEVLLFLCVLQMFWLGHYLLWDYDCWPSNDVWMTRFLDRHEIINASHRKYRKHRTRL